MSGARAASQPCPVVRRVLASVAVLFAALLTSCASSPDQDPGDGAGGADLVVETEAGAVRGKAGENHRRFQGIPYAAAPTGERRWAPPGPPEPWEGELDATAPGHRCPQLDPESGEPTGDEDCLFANVTTPADEEDEALPVMVWIHGDGAIGSGDLFDPTALAADGEVVVVTVNYRLGVFGGFGHPELEGSGTNGLQDQQRALHWVRDNAAAFGGDPENVTLFGESYGANSVGAHLLSPSSEGLFDKAVMQSGSMLMDMPAESFLPGMPAAPWFGWTTTEQAQQTGARVAAELGCPDPARALDCLRDLPTEEILAYPQIMNIFQPFALGNDMLPADPTTALADGELADVPVMAGTTRDEHRTFVAFFRPEMVTREQYPELLTAAFGEDADVVAGQYPLDDHADPSLAWSAVLTDRMWAQSQWRQNTLLAEHSPVYFYEFADRNAPADTRFPPGFDPGAWHGADVGYLFPTPDLLEQMTPEQRQLSAEMIAYWSAFARSGDPGTKSLPAWEPFTGDGPVLRLAPGQDGITPTDYRTEHQLDFWERLEPDTGQAPETTIKE